MLTVCAPFVPAQPTSATVAAPLAGGRVRLALVANGKPNSVELLDRMAAHLDDHLAVGEVRVWRKPSVSVPPPDEDGAEIAEWADAVLAAVGD